MITIGHSQRKYFPISTLYNSLQIQTCAVENKHGVRYMLPGGEDRALEKMIVGLSSLGYAEFQEWRMRENGLLRMRRPMQLFFKR